MSVKSDIKWLLAIWLAVFPCFAFGDSLNLSPLSSDPLGAYVGLPRQGMQLPGDAAPPSCVMPDLREHVLTLIETVDLSICHNPQLRAAWAAVKQEANALGEARAAYLPTATINTSRTRTDSKTGVLRDNVTGNTLYAAINWEVYDFGARAAQESAAASLLQAALARNDAALQKTLADTIQAYFDVQSARATWQAKQLGASTAAATLASAKRRESQGILARGDRLQAATALARSDLEQSRAFGNYRKGMAVLVYLMGLPTESAITLSEEADDDEIALAMQLDHLEKWLHASEQSHPAIRGARAEWEAAQSKVVAVRAENKPSITLSGNVYKNGYPGQGVSATASQVRTIGLALNIPLFDGYAHAYKVREAEAQAEQKEQALADTEDQTLMEVVRVYEDASTALRNLKASRELLSAAEESMESCEHKYAHDASDIVEVLAAQAALADAREQRIISVFEWRSARLRLIANSGMLGRAKVMENAAHLAVPSAGRG